MKLLLSVAKRKAASPWICYSCRGVKHAAIPYGAAASRDSQASKASKALREQGPARTRFAPSPTGYLHLGSLRTALFNYLVAKATGGQFLLRIEDTDQKRTIPGAEERLYEDLDWAGLQWDEGPKIGGPYGPYKQSERTALYREYADKLLESGSAYRCFCTPERLHTLAELQSKLGLPADYDRTCTHVPKEESDDRAATGEAHVIRLKVPDQKDAPLFRDLVYGVIRPRKDLMKSQQAKNLAVATFDDPVLLKSDGFPTYHLANVVDDHLMEITHVIRGSEWISSTPKHLAMYQAFGWQPPAFAHVGLLLDKNRQKLSKRTGSIDISEWRNKGIFPETLTNFIALLGWSHQAGSDVMSMEDLIKNASMKYTKGDTVVAFEKLWFLQRRHAVRYAKTEVIGDEGDSSLSPSNPAHSLVELAVKPIMALLDSPSSASNYPFYQTITKPDRQEKLVKDFVFADAQNYTNPSEFVEKNKHFFASPSAEILVETLPRVLLTSVHPKFDCGLPGSHIIRLSRRLMDIPADSWFETAIRSCLLNIIQSGMAASREDSLSREDPTYQASIEDEESLLRRAWAQVVNSYLRWVLVARTPGPDNAIIMEILGKEETRRRFTRMEEVLKGLEIDKQEETV